MLRSTWSRKRYLSQTCDDPNAKKPKPFLVAEDSSKVTLEKLTELMGDSYAWASIALVAHVSSEAELIGRWSEGCGCPEHQVPSGLLGIEDVTVNRRKRKPRQFARGEQPAINCCFRGCRAPELATGCALTLQSVAMKSTQSKVLEYISRAPERNRPELHGSWSKARGQLWGNLLHFIILYTMVVFCFGLEVLVRSLETNLVLFVLFCLFVVVVLKVYDLISNSNSVFCCFICYFFCL